MATIEVEGKKYKVTENLGYQAGHYAKAVETETGERIAVKRGGGWTWWTVQDRLQRRGQCVGMSNVTAHVRAVASNVEQIVGGTHADA